MGWGLVLLALHLVASAVLLGTGGCWHYSFTGTLPTHIKTVAVPLFEDKAFEHGLAELLTDAVISAFGQSLALKVVDEERADSVLQGTVVSVVDEAVSYTASEQVQERRIAIRIDVTYYDVRNRKMVWERQGIEEWGTYDPSDPSSRDSAIAEAAGKLGREMINLTLSDW